MSFGAVLCFLAELAFGVKGWDNNILPGKAVCGAIFLYASFNIQFVGGDLKYATKEINNTRDYSLSNHDDFINSHEVPGYRRLSSEKYLHSRINYHLFGCNISHI